MTTQRPPVSIASVLLQVFSGLADDPPHVYPASDLPAMVVQRSNGCIKPKVGTIVAELSKLKKAGLVTWRAAEGRRPKDSRGARWMLTARGMERAAEEREIGVMVWGKDEEPSEADKSVARAMGCG